MPHDKTRTSEAQARCLCSEDAFYADCPEQGRNRPRTGDASPGLTEEQLITACLNVGVDITCGACAMLFYTGYTGPTSRHDALPSEHDASCLTERRSEAARPDCSCRGYDDEITCALHGKGKPASAPDARKHWPRPEAPSEETTVLFGDGCTVTYVDGNAVRAVVMPGCKAHGLARERDQPAIVDLEKYRVEDPK